MSPTQKQALKQLINGLTVTGLDNCKRVVMIDSIIDQIPVEEIKEPKEESNGKEVDS